MTHRLGFLAVLALIVAAVASCGGDTVKIDGGDPDGFTFGGTCEGKECGTDGKGNSCGICAPDKYCIAGK
ncbi:MAG: hypothetical protein FJ109_17850, partial [Deltaproteobacteria bacterium]|nr:hypothetical protein [Deltaproteobacteria bacterium]